MEDFLVFWELFYSSNEFWNLEPFDKKLVEDKISYRKLEYLNPDLILARLKNLKEGIKSIKISEEVMDLIHQEYLSNHNNIVDVLNSITDTIDSGEAF